MPRETPWRQGHLIVGEALTRLGMCAAEDADESCGIVISHDCDLQSLSEPEVEILIGRRVSAIKPELATARSTRMLHLSYTGNGSPEVAIEVGHNLRHRINWEQFAEEDPTYAMMLADDQKQTLKLWLAARYGRAAFPNTFENRLRKTVRKGKTVDRLLARALRDDQHYLVAVYFGLDERKTELPEGAPYDLTIAIVYDSQAGLQARQRAERAVADIKDLFLEAYGDLSAASEIVLSECTAVSDEDFSLFQVRRMDQWRVEHLSLESDEGGPILPLGQ